jgi:hypothetical protein
MVLEMCISVMNHIVESKLEKDKVNKLIKAFDYYNINDSLKLECYS